MLKKKILIVPLILIISVIIFVLSKWLPYAFPEKVNVTKNEHHYCDTKPNFNSIVPGVYILSEKNKYESVGAIFESVGFDVVVGDLKGLKSIEKDNLILIVPEKEGKSLNSSSINYIENMVKDGMKLITWGKTNLSKNLGISFDGNSSLFGYTWYKHTDMEVKIKNKIAYDSFDFANEHRTIAYVGTEDKEVAISSNLDKGGFIYSAIPLAIENASGFELYPFLMEAIRDEFNIKPIVSRPIGAVYMDIAYHINDKPSDVAQMVQDYGIDQVNISAWYTLFPYVDNFMSEFIGELHKRGIKAFAWFELPYVSLEFWNENPQWREKTASGEDALIDWRSLMALDNPECMEAVQKHLKEYINHFDWDGVDIAEIYYESPGLGFGKAEIYTPMNDSFRKSFEKKYGIDPKQIFNPTSKNYWMVNKEMKNNLIEYRVETITKLHDEILSTVDEIKKDKPYIQTVVTIIDSLIDTKMRENIGVDINELAKLQKKYHFAFQVEDPFTLWALGPERYKIIGEAYRKIIGNEKLNIDINVVERFDSKYPFKKQRGLELYQLLHYASKYTDQVIMYTLSTLEKDDMAFSPYATVCDVKVQDINKNEFKFTADKQFVLEIDTKNKSFELDGKAWPAYSDKGVIIPGGEHVLKVLDTNNDGIRIERINGTINSCFINDGTINLNYTTDGRGFITFSHEPSSITLDGVEITPEHIELNGQFILKLPVGQHELTIK